MAAHNGTLHFLGLFMPVEQLAMMPLLLNRKSIIGLLIGGVAETQEVLDFCAEHNIRPEINLINIDKIDEDKVQQMT